MTTPTPPAATQTFTLTFGECAENHVGMQKLGAKTDQGGFTLADLTAAQTALEAQHCVCELIDLHRTVAALVPGVEPAYVLVVRGGLEALLAGRGTGHDFFREQAALPKDTRAKMYGRVVNKRARHNLCFADAAQEPDYEAGRGRVVAFATVPLLQAVREALPTVLGAKAAQLLAEGNYYYDLTQCGIGFHGDSERCRVVGVRVGASMPLHYQWFQHGKPVGDRVALNLDHGDIYVMSDKAVGHDWKMSRIPTLRHAAGARKYLTIAP